MPAKPVSNAIKLNAASQIGVALGIVIQIATGVEGYPTIPPGAVLAVVVALLLLFVRWRYIGAVGLVYALWMVIGALTTSGTGQRLADPGSVGPFVGTLVQVIAIVVGLVTGIVAVVQAFRPDRVSV